MRTFVRFRALSWTAAVAAALCLSACGPAGTAPSAKYADKDKAALDKAPPPPADRFRTDSFDHIAENPFTAARTDPLSTFAASVDTASYGIVRRSLLQDHRLPPPDAVRTAELVNYFPYHYPPPDGEDAASLTVHLADCPWDAKHYLARIGVQGKVLDPDRLPPRNLVFLVDTSGSMNPPDRLPLYQFSLKQLVGRLTAHDRVALVAYAGRAGLVLPSTPGDQKETIARAIDRLSAGGSTNGGEGIELAYKIAAQNYIQGGLNRVILGTDGDFNVGVSSPGDLERLVEEKAKTGVFLTVLGFGMGNLKDSTMEKLAYYGNGHYAYIDSPAEARKVFVEQGAALAVIAKDVKLQVEFNPKRVGAYRLIGYENRLLRDQDFNDDAKRGGAIGAGHTVTALYEIVPAGQPLPVPGVDPLKYQKTEPTEAGGDEWLTVKMRYKEPDGETSKVVSRPLAGEPLRLADAPADFRFAAAVAAFGQLLRDSEYKGDVTYGAVRALAKDAPGDDAGGHRAEFLTLIDAADRLDRRGGR
jgi:Ca-activated chloride channel family protein